MTELQAGAQSNTTSSKLLFTIIIPALNEEKVIGKCLAALSAMDFPRDQFEVLLVDNGSTDRTIHVASSSASSLNFRVMEKQKVHISAMRNLGAAEARGVNLAFLDADCLVRPDWLAAAANLLKSETPGIVGAHYEIPADSTWVGKVWYADRTAAKSGDVSYVPAGDLILSRETFLGIGGFDESIQTNEDFELCKRAREAGLSVRSYPELRVIHLGTPRTLKQFYKKQRWHGTHVFAVFLRDFRKKSNLRPVLLSIYTFLTLSGVFVGTLLRIAGRGWLIFGVSGLALVIPLFLIALRGALMRGRLLEAPQATLLYLTFAVARAACLLDTRSWRSPVPASDMPRSPVSSDAATGNPLQ